METLKKEKMEGLTIKVHPDDDVLNPRTEYDNMGKMICFHRRYTLGDDHNMEIEEVKEIAEDSKNFLSLPLFLYDHSGITMSTSSFSCPWDSGQVGIIYMDLAKLIEEYGEDTEETRKKAFEYLRSEVVAYDRYLRGEAYGYTIEDEDGEQVGSCWGFDDADYCLEEAKAEAKGFLESLQENGTYVI